MAKIGKEAINFRVQKMLHLRAKYEADLENAHVRLQPGNSKTGKACYTVSLIPIADCKNCRECKKECYDIRNVCFQPTVQNDRARNSAIHRKDRERYWREIEVQLRANYITQLRLNVGGDLDDEDFEYVAAIGARNPKCEILFFTKNDDGCNRYIEMYLSVYPDNFGFPKNVHPLYSRWPGMEMKNPYHVPESHVLWPDGSTTAPEFGSVYCGGNCSECYFEEKGCWALKAGESVILKAH